MSPHNVLQSPDYECRVAHWDKPRKQKKKKKTSITSDERLSDIFCLESDISKIAPNKDRLFHTHTCYLITGIKYWKAFI